MADGGTEAPASQVRDLRDDRELTDLELVLWLMDGDPQLRSAYAALSLLDRPPDTTELQARMQTAAARVPRLRRRVVQRLGRMSPAVWSDDPDFDVRLHVREVTAPKAAGPADLSAIAAEIVARPFAPDRPLWELVVINGGTSGQSGLVWKFHHAVADGVGAIRLSEQFLDIERSPEPSEPQVPDTAATAPSQLTSAIAGITHNTKAVTNGALTAIGQAANLATTPSDWAQIVDVAGDLVRQTSSIAGGPKSDLWTERTERRVLFLLNVDLDDGLACAHRHGGTLNHFFVAGAVQAARRYHEQLGSSADSFRMAMPMSTRADNTAGGNDFTPVQIEVNATGDLADQIPAMTTALHSEASGLQGSLVSAAMGVGSLLPSSVVRSVVRRQTSGVDFTTSNVRGAPFDLYTAGALMEANHPIGPIAGTAFNLTLMSYRGQLNLGLHVDAGAIAEPERLHAALVDSYRDLIAL